MLKYATDLYRQVEKRLKTIETSRLKQRSAI